MPCGPATSRRFLWANIGAYHVCLSTFTLSEA